MANRASDTQALTDAVGERRIFGSGFGYGYFVWIDVSRVDEGGDEDRRQKMDGGCRPKTKAPIHRLGVGVQHEQGLGAVHEGPIGTTFSTGDTEVQPSFAATKTVWRWHFVELSRGPHIYIREKLSRETEDKMER
jgi:hypothetical protein